MWHQDKIRPVVAVARKARQKRVVEKKAKEQSCWSQNGRLHETKVEEKRMVDSIIFSSLLSAKGQVCF